jgi:hypothetical protein
MTSKTCQLYIKHVDNDRKEDIGSNRFISGKKGFHKKYGWNARVFARPSAVRINIQLVHKLHSVRDLRFYKDKEIT